MNTQHHFLILTVVFLAVGLMATETTFAKGPPGPEVKVLSATPGSLQQGEMENIVIRGSGFDSNAKVKFLVGGTKDASQIDVKSVTYVDAETLMVSIEVLGEALTANYDIEVQASSGRKGKGTTLFAVTEKKTVYTCNEAFPTTDPRICSCMFSRRAEINSGTPPLIDWGLLGDCNTHATVTIGEYELLTGGNFKLTAMPTFIGHAVITARGHRAQLVDLWIDIDFSVDAGCGDAQLHSAISFVLDENSANPRDSAGFEMNTYPATTWVIQQNMISTNGASLCHAIEVRRTEAYGLEYPPATINPSVAVIGNVINANSYSRTGILFGGFTRSDRNVLSMDVSGNTIDPATNSSANAIQFGPLFGAEAGIVGSNLITLNGGTGLLLVDGPGGAAETVVDVSRNDIMGASVGILVDSDVADATIKLNVLTGASGDIGVCTEEPGNTSLHGNKFNGYDNPDKIVEFACGSNPSD
jgi:hypothetical protein